MFDYKEFFPSIRGLDNNVGKFLAPIDEKHFRKFKKKKFFELEDWIGTGLFKDIWFWMIDGKKGIGKTYRITKLLNEIDNSDRKVMFGRMTRDEKNALKDAMNTDTKTWPFFVKKDQLYSRRTKKHKGTLFYITGNGLQKFTSLQFPEYDLVLVDEYQPLVKPDKDWDNYVKLFLRFLSDVQRDKPNLRVEMYGNNNSDFNPFKKFFKTDFRHKILVDRPAGLAVINLREYYIGVSTETNVTDLMKYDDELSNFFSKNDSGELTNDIMPLSLFEKLWPEFQVVFRGKGYIFYYIEKKYLVVKQNSFLHSEIDIFSTNMKDLTLVQGAQIITRLENYEIVFEIIEAMLNNDIAYDSPDTKNIISMMVQEYLPLFQKDTEVLG